MSGELQSVVITTPNPTAPSGHDEAMIAVAEGRTAAAAAAAPAVVPARPAWLPEKFKTPEDMAASYAALEAKQSGALTPAVVPPVAAAVVPPADALNIATPDAAAAAAASAGLDMAALNAEFRSSGALSEASMAALAAKGFDRATVDGYVAGQQALATAFQSEVKSVTPGGAEKYGEMMTWAKANLSAAEIDAYNTSISTSNKEQAKLLVAGLGARFSASVGNEPSLLGGRVASSSGDAFESIAQMKVAMGNPLYKSDPAFRKAVQEKLGRSSIL